MWPLTHKKLIQYTHTQIFNTPYYLTQFGWIFTLNVTINRMTSCLYVFLQMHATNNNDKDIIVIFIACIWLVVVYVCILPPWFWLVDMFVCILSPWFWLVDEYFSIPRWVYKQKRELTSHKKWQPTFKILLMIQKVNFNFFLLYFYLLI